MSDEISHRESRIDFQIKRISSELLARVSGSDTHLDDINGSHGSMGDGTLSVGEEVGCR